MELPLLSNVSTEDLAKTLCGRDDLRDVSENVKSILLFKLGDTLFDDILAETRRYVGLTKKLTTFENIPPETFLASVLRCLPILKFLEGVTGRNYGTVPVTMGQKLQLVSQTQQYVVTWNCAPQFTKIF